MDSSLSVEMLADIAGLSPAYSFGKLFFTTVHVSCNDYLMELRLRKAASFCGNTGYGQYDQPGCGNQQHELFFILFSRKSTAVRLSSIGDR